MCFEEFKKQGLSDEQAEEKSKVSWKDFEADHILAYIRGGKTSYQQPRLAIVVGLLSYKTKDAQVNELLAKVLCHNICVVIQEMHELGLKPSS